MCSSDGIQYTDAPIISVAQSEWSVEFEFRATGPERGSGNIQLWYTKDGPTGHPTSSIYTVGHFDGVVLVIDSYGGKVLLLIIFSKTEWDKILKVTGRRHSRLYE